MTSAESSDPESPSTEEREVDTTRNRNVLFWRVVNALQFVHAILWSAFWISAALVVRWTTRSDRLPLTMARNLWAPGVLAGGAVRLSVEGLERIDTATNYLFAANHQSILDIPALFRALPIPVRFVARSGVRRLPFIGSYMRAVGMVFVEESRGVRAASAIEHAAQLLRDVGSLVTFPEGTRTRDGDLGRFRGAAVAPAIAARTPVVPVSIQGAFEILPRGGFRPRPGTLRIEIGGPIDTEGLSLEDRHALADRVQAAIREMRAASTARKQPPSEAAPEPEAHGRHGSERP